jgi:hypothetical protein
MRLRVTPSLQLKLVETGDFRCFELEVSVPRTRLSDVAEALRGVAELEGADHAWVSGDWIVRHCEHEVPQWYRQFDGMVAFAQTRGWVRTMPLKIRVHLVWPAGTSGEPAID